MFSFSLFGKVIGICMLVNACFNIFILFKYPQFDDAQRNQAQAEIKDFLAANPAFQQQVVDAGFKVGFDFFKSNPGMFLIMCFCYSNIYVCLFLKSQRRQSRLDKQCLVLQHHNILAQMEEAITPVCKIYYFYFVG